MSSFVIFAYFFLWAKDFERRETPGWMFTWLKLSDETSPLPSPAIFSGFSCVNRSQIDSPLPWAFQPPSIWYADEPTPHKKSDGNFRTETEQSLKLRKRVNYELVRVCWMLVWLVFRWITFPRRRETEHMRIFWVPRIERELLIIFFVPVIFFFFEMLDVHKCACACSD